MPDLGSVRVVQGEVRHRGLHSIEIELAVVVHFKELGYAVDDLFRRRQRQYVGKSVGFRVYARKERVDLTDNFIICPSKETRRDQPPLGMQRRDLREEDLVWRARGDLVRRVASDEHHAIILATVLECLTQRRVELVDGVHTRVDDSGGVEPRHGQVVLGTVAVHAGVLQDRVLLRACRAES